MMNSIQEKIESLILQREVFLDLVYPSIIPEKPLRLLVLNDGQDAAAYHLVEVMTNARATKQIEDTLAVAVHVGERKQEYGISHRPDFAKRGSRANHYAAFIEKELLPFLQSKFQISQVASERAIAGFSLGALSAFDVAWHYPQVFGVAGLFSGSFWWRTKALDDGYQPNDRIAHQLVKESLEKKPIRLWFQTGWLDEFADRDSDGLIDSVGDTLDLIVELKEKKFVTGSELEYVELGNGRHDHKTMAKIFPAFLMWWQQGQLFQN